MQSSITSFFVKKNTSQVSQVDNKELEHVDSDLESLSSSLEGESQEELGFGGCIKSSEQSASSNSSSSDSDTDSPVTLDYLVTVQHSLLPAVISVHQSAVMLI